jgi:ABC-2 type transport system ATP-binding protein
MMNGSNDNLAVEVKNVSMRFNSTKEKVDSIKEYMIKFASRKLFFEEFWALNDISIEVKRGEVFGIIGYNGAGKSTLLKIIAGVMKPTKGRVIVTGTMAPLIELGAGFDMDLSARENIYLNGAILGHSKKYIKERFDEIVDFSELQDFIDLPVKNYSSGMAARLGFAIATITEPDILIVDEVLGIGDIKFQEKCAKKMGAMLSKKATVIMVSHSISEIEKMCDRVLWLEQGRFKMLGETKEVCVAYQAE